MSTEARGRSGFGRTYFHPRRILMAAHPARVHARDLFPEVEPDDPPESEDNPRYKLLFASRVTAANAITGERVLLYGTVGAKATSARRRSSRPAAVEVAYTRAADLRRLIELLKVMKGMRVHARSLTT